MTGVPAHALPDIGDLDESDVDGDDPDEDQERGWRVS
jgi:hypothetical protein